jgi:hypothetical protein
LPSQRADVRAAANTLHHWYPDIQVESYLAMRDGRLLSFHELAN